MNMRHPRGLLLVLVAVALAACARQAGEPTTPPPTRPAISVPPIETIEPSEGEPVTGEVPQEVLDSIIADAARRTGAGEDEVEVVQAISVTWNDGSLGCPEPGMSYTMALVDGYHVIVTAEGEELDYRAAEQGGFRVCENGGRPGG
jgi:hypothetical protein